MLCQPCFHSSLILSFFSETAVPQFSPLYFFSFPLQVAAPAWSDAAPSGSDPVPPALHTCFLVNEGILSLLPNDLLQPGLYSDMACSLDSILCIHLLCYVSNPKVPVLGRYLLMPMPPAS